MPPAVDLKAQVIVGIYLIQPLTAQYLTIKLSIDEALD